MSAVLLESVLPHCERKEAHGLQPVGLEWENRLPEGTPMPDQSPCWHHLILSTYGSWLYGDPRGFRTRHHREHVEGDYKNPPPEGRYAERERRSRESLKCAPVCVPDCLRPVVGEALRDRLQELGAFVLCMSVGGQHLHILAKLPFGKAREWSGIAKRHAWFVLRDRGWKGKLWGKRGKALRVSNRQHQVNVYRYILGHTQEGAWVWKWSKPDAGES